MKRCLLSVTVALLAALPASCGAPDPPAAGRGKVRIAAAANLNAALAELIPRFSAARKVDVTATYGSSGTFFAQLINGAPFDVFLSADLESPKRLADRGLVVDNGTFTYAVGRIVVWVTGSSKLDPQLGGLRTLVDPDVKRIAVASPETSPYGRAAIAALKSEEIYDAVVQKLLYGENVAQALQHVQSGSADVGVVALSLVLSPEMKGGGRWAEVAPGAYPRLEQGGAIMRNAGDADAARAFRDYLVGSEGRAILQQFGYALP